MRHPELPVAAFLSVPLVLSSLPSHIRAGSISIIALIAWMAVVSTIRGINALVWAGNVDVKLQVWCDITTKITIGFTYAIPASALCVLRHLENVASTRNVRTTKSDKRRRQTLEALMCFGLPVIGMALHYVVQGHRLDIIEDFGCYPPVYFSIASLFILWVPPLVMSLGSFVYAALALHHFLRRRIEFAAHLRNSYSSISPGHYFRLMAMAVVEMIWDTGVNAYIIWFNISFGGFEPWISWENVHSNFSRVATFPAFLIPPVFMTQLAWQWWIVPISCLFFFLFFAFGEEARADYLAVLIWFRRNILRQNVAKTMAYGISPVLPTHSRLQSRNVDVSLPSTSDDASEHERKAWDQLSLDIPEITEHAVLPSNDDLPDPFATDRRLSQKEPTPEKHTPTGSDDTRSLSLDDSEQTYSIDTSDSSSITVAAASTSPFTMSPHSAHSTSVPALIVPHLESDVSPTANTHFVTLPTTQIQPPVLCPVPSPALSRPASFRRSISTDLGITVSPAYLPDVETASRYHEPVYQQQHGGIRMTVEKRVV